MDYEIGLDRLRKRLSAATISESGFLVFEQRLLDNLARELRYGSDENTRHERSRIVEELNKLALAQLGVSFNSLCPDDPHGASILTAPRLPAYYVERQLVLSSLQTLWTDTASDRRAPVAIWGMSGIGKTILAAALAEHPVWQARYPHGTLWATLGPQARTVEDVKPWLLIWGQALGLKLDSALPAHALATLLTSALHRKKCLIILDDVWSIPPATLLMNLCGRKCGAIITTREADVAVALGATLLKLDVLEPAEARQLVSRRLGRALTERESSSVDELLARLGYLPLAISLAAVQASLGLEWDEMLAAFRTAQPNLEMIDLTRAESREYSLQLSFDLTYNRLDEQAQRHYRALGVMAEEAPFVVEDIVPLWFDLPFDDSLAEAEWTRRFTEYRTIAASRLRNFVTWGILQQVGDSESRVYRQHTLLRSDALRRLNVQERTYLLEAHARWFSSLVDAWRQDQRFYVLERAGPQIYVILRRLKNGYSTLPGLALYDGDTARLVLVGLVLQLCEVWIRRRRYDDMIEWCSEALICCHCLGDKEIESGTLSNLGVAYLGKGEYAAAERAFNAALAMDRIMNRAVGQAANLLNLSSIFAQRDDYQRAIELVQEGYEIAQSIGDTNRAILSLNALGSYHAASGNHHKAKEILERVLSEAKAANNLGALVDILCSLGELSLTLGDPAHSLEYLGAALAANERVGDKTRSVELAIITGEALLALERTAEALQGLEAALATCEEIHHRGGVLRASTTLARAHLKESDFHRAIEYAKRAIEVAQHEGWSSHELQNLWLLAEALESTEQRKQIAEVAERIIALAQQLGDLRAEAGGFWLLAMQYGQADRASIDRAIECLERSLPLHEKLNDTRAAIDDLLALGRVCLSGAHSARQFGARSMLFSWRAVMKASQINDARRQMLGYRQLAGLHELGALPILEWQMLCQARKFSRKIDDDTAEQEINRRLNALRRKHNEVEFPDFSDHDETAFVMSGPAHLAAMVIEGCRGNTQLLRRAGDLALSWINKSRPGGPSYRNIFINFDDQDDFAYWAALGSAFHDIIRGQRDPSKFSGLPERARIIVLETLAQLHDKEAP